MANARGRDFQIYGVPLLSIVAAMTIIPTLWNTFRGVPLDFAVFMMSARWLREGLDPYRELLARHAPNTNPPAFLFALLPLTLVSDGVAFALWTTAAIVGLVLSLDLTSRALKQPLGILLVVAAGLQGVSAALRFGQVTLVLMPLITLAWLADREGRKGAAGAWLGALVYIKPFVGLFGLYMLWRREWRALRSMIAVFVALAGLGLLAGVGVTLSWIETLRSISEQASHVVNASWPALMSRMLMPDRSQPAPAYSPLTIAPRLLTVSWIAGTLAIALISFIAIRRTANRDHQWSIVGTAMLLISPLGWLYYTPLLIPPLAAIIPSARHLVLVIIAGALLWVPTSVLARNAFGPIATATYASPYTWGLLLLWAAVCLDGSEGSLPFLFRGDIPKKTTARLEGRAEFVSRSSRV